MGPPSHSHSDHLWDQLRPLEKVHIYIMIHNSYKITLTSSNENDFMVRASQHEELY